MACASSRVRKLVDTALMSAGARCLRRFGVIGYSQTKSYEKDSCEM